MTSAAWSWCSPLAWLRITIQPVPEGCREHDRLLHTNIKRERSTSVGAKIYASRRCRWAKVKVRMQKIKFNLCKKYKLSTLHAISTFQLFYIWCRGWIVPNLRKLECGSVYLSIFEQINSFTHRLPPNFGVCSPQFMYISIFHLVTEYPYDNWGTRRSLHSSFCCVFFPSTGE